MKKILFCFTFVSSFFVAKNSYSQIATRINSFHPLDYYDSSSLTLNKSIRDVSERFTILDPRILTSYNSSYPRGFNDGPVWKGKGLTIETQAGLAAKKGKFSFIFYPTVYFSQNSSFILAPERAGSLGRFSYQFARGVNNQDDIDWVQRYGDDVFIDFHMGQSELKFQSGKFIAAVSTQNYSLGPSYFNPILLSPQSGGFPHLRLSKTPFDVKIKNINTGKWEVNFIAGLLSESKYFDSNPDNNVRYLNGLFLAYQPSFLPNLTLGFNKILYKNTQFFEPKDIFSTILVFDGGVRGDSINTNDTFDQIASFTIDWNFPEVEFRVYLEFAKNDFNGSISNYFQEPDHSRAYSIGFEKTIKTNKNKQVIVNYEHTNLSRNHTYLWRATPVFYAHGINKQGYTNNGQIIGAGIGPGANSDHFGIRIVDGTKLIGLLIQRIENNKDYFVVNVGDIENRDMEYSLGASYQKKLSAMTFSLESTFSFNYDRYYLENETNVYLSINSIIHINK